MRPRYFATWCPRPRAIVGRDGWGSRALAAAVVLVAIGGAQSRLAAQPPSATGAVPTPTVVPTVSGPGKAATPTPSATPTSSSTPAAAISATPGSAKAVPTISAAQYDAQLAAAESGLLSNKAQGVHHTAMALAPLAQDVKVRRADGAIQEVGPDLWNRLGGAPVAGNLAQAKGKVVSRAELLRALEIVRAQRQALRAWAFPDPDRYYKAADVKSIMAEIVASHRIKTGPSWWESRVQDWTKTLGQWWTSFANWLNGLFPKPSTPNLPNVNFNWLWIVFWSLVVVMLAVLGFALSNSLRGKVGRRIRRSDLTLEGEDAQLLLLPPEELRQRAQEFAREGDFTQALRYRYLSMLLVLDSRGIWKYNPRRTNWEHIAGLRKNPDNKPFIAPLSDLTRRFDRVRYGGAWCAPGDWDEFEAACDALENRFASPVGARA